ncbi:2-keto-4-pentenoate hydratase [Streptomyces sp. NPDC048527]|uniref:2-keto-4-pentenoate hydratase n=1 Tax=Streptomyces sp. NPDC048527 TaxID=3365568 RepID=UPI0037204E8B
MPSASRALDAGAAEALRQLTEARARRRPGPPVRGLLPEGDIDAAYAVQAAWAEDSAAAGARVIGRKIGLTSPAVRAQLGVDQPDFGVLLDSMEIPEGASVDITRTLQPRIEAEIAFVLERDLSGPAIAEAEVAAATGFVVAALEVVDSRIADWDIGIVDTVADNASSGLFVLGAHRQGLGSLDLAGCAMTMWRGRQVVSQGSGAACLGNPLSAVAWLARTAHRYGRPLRAGEIVLSGALGPMVPVAPGDGFRADISGLGQVSATFTEARERCDSPGSAPAAETSAACVAGPREPVAGGPGTRVPQGEAE